MSQGETLRSMFEDDGSVATYPYAVELAGLEDGWGGSSARAGAA